MLSCKDMAIMTESQAYNIPLRKLSDDEFRKLSTFIFENYGIKMPEIKRTILQCRLQKRLRELNLSSFKEYVDFVFSTKGQSEEVVHMIDVISTNKTDFYREPDHFTFLSEVALPEIIRSPDFHQPLKIWSAGCSSGEEAYTIAFTIEEFIARNRRFDYRIYGSDISSRIIKQANEAVYTEDRIRMMSLELRKKYLLRSVNAEKPMVRIIPEIRQKTVFSRMNLMDSKYDLPGLMDIVFCRNVLIYFNRQTQEEVLQKACNKLRPDGYLFLGHSESITNMMLPVIRVKPTIFKRK